MKQVLEKDAMAQNYPCVDLHVIMNSREPLILHKYFLISSQLTEEQCTPMNPMMTS